MAEYKYQGETFEVDSSDNCEVKVSDGLNTVRVVVNGGGYQFRSPTGVSGLITDTVQDSVESACRELVRMKSLLSRDYACKELSEFVHKLESES